jgi:uncharacterized protein YndB with AHSA1/START domain
MNTVPEAIIEVDPDVPIIRITRDFRTTPAQLLRAHVDPELFVKWIGPDGMGSRIDYWDARTGGSWRYLTSWNGEEFGFRGTFHEVREDLIVQTFAFEAAWRSVSTRATPSSTRCSRVASARNNPPRGGDGHFLDPTVPATAATSLSG